MNLGTRTTAVAQAAGVSDSTDSSRKQQITHDLTTSGFTEPRREFRRLFCVSHAAMAVCSVCR